MVHSSLWFHFVAFRKSGKWPSSQPKMRPGPKRWRCGVVWVVWVVFFRQIRWFSSFSEWNHFSSFFIIFLSFFITFFKIIFHHFSSFSWVLPVFHDFHTFSMPFHEVKCIGNTGRTREKQNNTSSEWCWMRWLRCLMFDDWVYHTTGNANHSLESFECQAALEDDARCKWNGTRRPGEWSYRGLPWFYQCLCHGFINVFPYYNKLINVFPYYNNHGTWV